MSTGGNDVGNAGGDRSENKGESDGAAVELPVCHLCHRRHRPEARCWEPCSRCGNRHHWRSACRISGVQQQRMATLQRQNAQMSAELQRIYAQRQQRSANPFAYDHGAFSPRFQPYPSYPSFPFEPWQLEQVVPPMGMGAFTYNFGDCQPPRVPPMMPPNPFTGGSTVVAPQGRPSTTFNMAGDTSRQIPRRVDLSWNNRRQGSRRLEKKANKNHEKEKNGKKAKGKEKARDVLAAKTSGVQKLAKHHKKNMERRNMGNIRRQTGVEEDGKGKSDGEMSGIEST